MCPCRLVLDMTDVDTLVVKYAEIVVTASDGYGMRDTLEVDAFDEGYMLEVPRGDVGVGVYFGAGGSVDDQKRITTPRQARERGSDYIVVGRPITAAADPVAAYDKCVNDFLTDNEEM